jgi:hypothetical protein
MSDARKRAWQTRRAKYGSRGHSGAYLRFKRGDCNTNCSAMRDLIVRLHNDGVLSEGQAARATGMHRIDLRIRADELRDKPDHRLIFTAKNQATA